MQAKRKTRKNRTVKTQSGSVRRSSRRRGKRGLYWVCVLLTVAVVAVILSLTVFFKIDTITVDPGETGYTAQEVIELCGIKKGDNLWLASSDKAEKTIKEQLPYAEKVRVSKKLTDTIVITLTEPQIEAATELNGSLLLISGEGRVLPGSTENSVRYLSLGASTVADGYIDKEAAQRLADYNEIYLLLEEKGYLALTDSITATSISEAGFVYDGRIQVKLGGTDRLEEKLNVLIYFVENNAEPDAVGIYYLSDPTKSSFRPLEWRSFDETPAPVTESGENEGGEGESD